LGLTQGTTAYVNASLKDIFFNKTPVLRAGASNTAPQDADFNFSNVDIATRFGTQAQSYVPGFDAVEEEVGVGADVLEGLPITRTITDTNIDAARITINVPVLQKITSKGDIIGAEIQLEIAVQYNSGGFTTVIADTIKGRTSDLYQRDYIVNLTGAFPVDIRITRITPDSTSVKLSNAFSWFSYTEIIYQKLRYPNSAYVALRIDAEQFNSIPSRSYKIRGVKVSIPSNATADITTGRLTYAGIWNGTFGAAAWTTDPAWILWDLLTSTRFGLGDHIQPATLDKWAFFRASQYCNELVPTGLTSPATEPRFSCNVNIQTAEEAYKVINDMCSVFRAMPFWSAGSLTVAQDRPSDPVALFSLSNVTEEGFSYEGSSLKTRATVAIVSWLNLELGDIDREVVEDAEGIAKYGVITKEISAFATTSKAQAHRLGRWLLYSERYEGEVVSFVTGLENGIILRPGAIIDIADPVKAGARRGGRINAATSSTVTVDNDVDLPTFGTISVVLSDGIVETRTISSVSGGVIAVASNFSSPPQAGSVWLVENAEIQPTQWRVLGVQEQDGINFAVTAISYNATKYGFIENGEPLEQRTISILNTPPSAPINVLTEELQYVLNGRVASKLSVAWQSVRGVNEYRVRWRGEFDNWKEVRTYGPIYEIEDVTAGLYNIEIYSISATQLLSSSPAELSVTVQGVGAPPADPTGVSLVPINESTAIIQWDLATDLDVLVGGEVLIRHDPRATNVAEWGTSNAIVQAAAGNQTQKQVPLLEGTYFVAFRDQSGNRSVNPVAIEAVLPTPQPRLLIKTWAEENETPPFNGTDTNLAYDVGLNALFLNSSVDLEGEYIYEDYLDLGQVYDVNIRRRIIGFPLNAGVNFDDVSGLFDDQPGKFDGDDLDQTNAVTYVRVTNDNPAGTPTWGPWNEYVNAIVRGRAIELKVVATTTTAQVGMAISELGAVAELQQRMESGSDSGSSTYTVTFADAFYATPEVVISPSNMATGDFFTLSSVSRTGFTVAFKNSSNAAVTRSYAYTATGYGKEI
jgi:predicted phage tail protein